MIVWANPATWLFNDVDNAAEFTAKGLTATDCETFVVGGVGIVCVVTGWVVVVTGVVVVVVVGAFVVVVVGAFVVVVVVGAFVVVVVVGAFVVVVVGVVVVVTGGDVVVVTGLEAPAVYSATQSTCSEFVSDAVGHPQPLAHQVCC